MLNEFTLNKQELTEIHNSLCDLDSVVHSLERVVHPDLVTRLVKARDSIRLALKNVYAKEREEFDRRHDYINTVSNVEKFSSIWSIYEVKDFYTEHPHAQAKNVIYRNHWGPQEVRIPITGNRWVDLWAAADKAIRQSKDEHHVFIESFTSDGDDLVLSTGS